jgi:hypothetical protein
LNLEDGACLGSDPMLWDTVTRSGHTSRLGYVKIKSGRIPRTKQIAIAKSICKTCPVQSLCLNLGINEEEGIWGGKLPDERQRMKTL